MLSAVTSSRKKLERQQERRAFAFTAAACLLVALTVYVWAYGSAYLAYWNYSPEEGDILFQSLPHSRLVNAIEGATESSYSHCGIVSNQNGRWVVYEAYRNVEETPLRDFVFRGRNQGFAVYRLRNEYRKYTSPTIANARNYLGRPYDARYRMDDEQIYCSELIYKAFLQSSAQQLGKLVPLSELNWRPFRETIKFYEKGPVPLDRKIITPGNMASATQLQLIFAYQMSVPDPG